MLKSTASRTVLALLVVIGAFELGISGKFSKIWALAFNPTAAVSGNVNNPTAASQQAHRSGQ